MRPVVLPTASSVRGIIGSGIKSEAFPERGRSPSAAREQGDKLADQSASPGLAKRCGRGTARAPVASANLAERLDCGAFTAAFPSRCRMFDDHPHPGLLPKEKEKRAQRL